MKNINLGMGVFTGIFVGMVAFLMELFLPDVDFIIRIIVIALAAFIGGSIGLTLFPNKKDEY